MERPLHEEYDGWTLLEHLNVRTGKLNNTYKFRGVKAQRIVLSGALADQFKGYTLIRKDLKNIRAWVGILQDLIADAGIKGTGPRQLANAKGGKVKTDEMKAVWVAIITFYGKLFSDAPGRRIRLDKQQIPASLRERHDRMINLRNGFTAHSGKEKFEDVEVVLVIDSNTSRMTPPRIITELVQPNMMISAELGAILELLTELESVVKKAYDKCWEKLYDQAAAENFAAIHGL